VPWRVEDGLAISAKDDIVTTNQFGDMQLHLEFREPILHGRVGQDVGTAECS